MLLNHLPGQPTISLLESSFMPTVGTSSRFIYRQHHIVASMQAPASSAGDRRPWLKCRSCHGGYGRFSCNFAGKKASALHLAGHMAREIRQRPATTV